MGNQSEFQPQPTEINDGVQSLSEMPSWDEHIKSFENAKNDNQIPEGVRDAQDYAEYMSERDAHEKEWQKKHAEKIKADQDFLKESGYSEEDIRGFFYDLHCDEDGEETADINQPIEYLLCGTSIKDLAGSGLFDMNKKDKFLNDISSFADEVYYVADHGYNREFNARYNDGVLTMISSIITSHCDLSPLNKTQRDFIYDLYNEDEKRFKDVADTLLIGKGEKYEQVGNLCYEVRNLMYDEPKDFAQRIVFVENKYDELRRDSQWYAVRERLDLAQKDITALIWKHISSIGDEVERIKFNEGQGIYPIKELSNIGEMLLRNCDYMHYDSGPKVGKMMMDCGIEADRIIDTGFGGPRREIAAYYQPEKDSSYRLGMNIGHLLKNGIPKEDIIKNIKEKNIEETNVHINNEAVDVMRSNGFSNKDILRCYNPGVLAVMIREQHMLDAGEIEGDEDEYRLFHDPYGYRDKGFSDSDLIDYMAELLLNQ